ncbi:MAG: hypothetical protein J6W19_07865 [Prevotella sp.]|nr:hypothetical protein [Prevotella sp.]
MNRRNCLCGLLMLTLAAAVPKASAEERNVLTFIVNGKPMVFNMVEHPVITYTDNTLHIKTDASTVNVPVSQISGGALPKSVLLGDVNADFSVDVADIASVIDVMATGSGIANPLQQAADVNKDGTVDVADISAVIDIMAGK